MNDSEALARLGQAREAVSRRDWGSAYNLFTAADPVETLGPADLAMLAAAAYATGHLEATIEAWERVHAANLATGDRLSAAGAAVRVALHLLIDTGLLAPVRGWAGRAERLLEGHDDTPVHAWLAVVRTYERFLSGDFKGARNWAGRAIQIGMGHSEPAAAVLGRVAEARSLIFEGEVLQGLELLDEAAVAALSDELDPLSLGIVYCELLCACQGLAQYDRAEEWTDAMERWRRIQGIGSLGGRCRVHRAEILRLRGASVEAESEALRACEELRPYLRIEFGWPLTELGRIRLRNGDLAGAEEAFLEAHENGWEPQPGLALLRLAQGDVAAAASSIRDALDRPLNVPSKELPPNSELRRAPLLEAQVEIEIAAGDLDRARLAADELGRVAGSFESKGLRASAALSRGRVRLAEGKVADAGHEFDDAVRLWIEVGAPYETALARLELAKAHRAQGNEDRALLEFRAAQSTFERVGAMPLAERAAAGADGEVEATTPNRREQSPADKRGSRPTDNVFRREGEYWSIVFERRTVRLRDLIGLRYLGRLFADPGREYHVLDLVAGGEPAPAHASVEHESASSGSGDAGELLDARAKEAYRRRLVEIDEDVAEAQGFGDAERAARAEAEREFLVRELSRAVGLTGRHRRAGDAAERARASVTRAIRHAMARIAEHHPELGAHLNSTIRTGTYCVYLPDPRVPVAWQL